MHINVVNGLVPRPDMVEWVLPLEKASEEARCAQKGLGTRLSLNNLTISTVTVTRWATIDQYNIHIISKMEYLIYTLRLLKSFYQNISKII